MVQVIDAAALDAENERRQRLFDAIVAAGKKHSDKPVLKTDLWADFGDGTYRFYLGREHVDELERLCGYVDREGARRDLGIVALFGRMARGRAFLPTGEPDWANISVGEVLAAEVAERDLIQTIRLALVGGGEGVVDGKPVRVPPERAAELIKLYVDGRPLEEAWTLAFAILGARIVGRAPDPETGR